MKILTFATLALLSLSQASFANTRYICAGKTLRVTVYNSTDFFGKEKFVLLIANRLQDQDSNMGNLIGPVVLQMENGDMVETVDQLSAIERLSGFEILGKTFEFNLGTSSFVIRKGSQDVISDKKMICSFK